jgi:DNA invertase Pin-like site-specific DNA recombinase
MRDIVVKRISRDTETSDALAGQDERLTRAVGEGSHVAIGMTEDATAPGAISLAERPSWAGGRASLIGNSWDAIMVTRLDRITRPQRLWEV